MDEKWSFVLKKQKNCSEEEYFGGDNWDHLALDAEHRLVLCTIPGKRTPENVHALVQHVKGQLNGRVPALITTDEYPAYAQAIERAFYVDIKPAPGFGRPNPGQLTRLLPEELTYATVHKERENGQVVNVTPRLVFGTDENLEAALAKSKASTAVNTSFIERHNGTDRNRNARKARKTYCFSKNWEVHAAVGYFTLYSYNFCWCVRTLRLRQKNRTWKKQTPAMSAGLTDHVWSIDEWLSYPARFDSN
jgi:IS1 family transposase